MSQDVPYRGPTPVALVQLGGPVRGPPRLYLAGTLLVTVALLASGLIEIYFSYQESKEVLSALQREKAQAAAVRIEGFITEIEHQMGWVTQPRAVAAAPVCKR